MHLFSIARQGQPRASVQCICMTAVFMAFVFIMTFVPRIPIPFGYAHMGDAVIFLLVLFLPKRQACMAAAVGSACSDLLSGFPVWIIPTLFIKWVMVELVFAIAALPDSRKNCAYMSWRMAAAFSVSAIWMTITYAGAGAVLYGSAGAGMLMVPGLAGKGLLNVAAAITAGWLLQRLPAHI